MEAAQPVYWLEWPWIKDAHGRPIIPSGQFLSAREAIDAEVRKRPKDGKGWSESGLPLWKRPKV